MNKQIINITVDISKVKDGDLLVYENGAIETVNIKELVGKLNDELTKDLQAKRNDYIVLLEKAKASYAELETIISKLKEEI